MADKKLVDYINSALKSGKSPEGIKEALIMKGWSEMDVERALEEVQLPSKPAGKPVRNEQPAGKPKGGHGKIYLTGIILVVIILAVTGLYLMTIGFFNPQEEGPSGGGGAGVLCGDGTCGSGETYDTCPEDCEPPSTGPVSLSFSPSDKSASNGETFTLDIMISEAYDVFGFQFNVEFNPAVLEFVSGGEATFLNRDGQDSTFCVDYKTDTPGIVKNIACTRMGRGSVNGNGVLGRVTFKAIGTGTSDVKLSNVKIVNSKPAEISSTVSNGKVSVS